MVNSNEKVILVIDDAKLSRMSIVKILKREGHGILEAENGKDGIEMAKNKKPDLIFLDLLMPEIDGFEVLSVLQKEDLGMPIFIISADIQETSRQRCKELGAIGFLNKPVSENDLLKILQMNL